MAGSDSHLPGVMAHYQGESGLERALLAALAAAGKDPDRLKPEELAAVDEFHVRGRQATAALARELAPERGMRVLDAGCGLGGSARHLASEYGCRVTGVDLSGEYCRSADSLTRRSGLRGELSFLQGDAAELPFADRSFDIVWSQHASMNIPDKQRLYREFWRVLRPGGRLALYDVLAGEGGEPHFPVPWARDPSLSFLATPGELLATLAQSGFETLLWCDVTQAGRSWFQRQRDRMLRGGTPPLGLTLLLGPDFPLMARNQVLNLEENRIALIEAVLRRPGS